MDQGLERAEGSMEEVEEENDGDNQQQPVGLGKLSPFLTTIPTAMIKFSSLRKSKMPVSSDTKKLPDTKQSDFLEGPFGLGSLVFPSLQRFNNINFFLSMYCTVVLAQGKLEEQGRCGEWSSEVDKVDTRGRKGRVHDQT